MTPGHPPASLHPNTWPLYVCCTWVGFLVEVFPCGILVLATLSCEEGPMCSTLVSVRITNRQTCPGLCDRWSVSSRSSVRAPHVWVEGGWACDKYADRVTGQTLYCVQLQSSSRNEPLGWRETAATTHSLIMAQHPPWTVCTLVNSLTNCVPMHCVVELSRACNK